MSDLISREDLKKALHNFFDGKVIDEPAYILRDVFYHIDSAPTIPLPDFKEGYKQAIIDGKTNFSRPQGEWILVDDTEKFIAKCSVCGRIEDSRMVKDYPFCHCGADMRGEK